jgi:hypothetical protein
MLGEGEEEEAGGGGGGGEEEEEEEEKGKWKAYRRKEVSPSAA